MVGKSAYAIVVDAGSSGTRVRIFSVARAAPTYTNGTATSLPRLAELAPPDAVVADTLRTHRGISALADDPPAAARQVLGLLAAAAATLPNDALSTTPAYVMATGGVRLLPPRQSKALLDAIRGAAAQPGACAFDFRGARTLSGREEAFYGWLSASLLDGALETEAGAAGCHGCEKIGWLDLGGASAQIAHVVAERTEAETLPADALTTLELPSGRRVRVFAHSHNRLGKLQAFMRSCRFIAKHASPNGSVLRHPCLLAGDTLSLDYSLDGGGEPVTVRGTGRGATCAELVRYMLVAQPDQTECAGPRCGLPLPHEDHYYAAGYYYYLAVHLGLARENARALAQSHVPSEQRAINAEFERFNVTVAQYESAGLRLCAKTAHTAQKEMLDRSVKWEEGRYSCFSGLYVAAMLRRSYGFADHAPPLSVIATHHGTTIDWTLGALLHEMLGGGARGPAAEAYAVGHGGSEGGGAAAAAVILGLLPLGCRRALSAGAALPLVCLVPVGWCVMCFICLWAVSCTWLRCKWRDRAVRGRLPSRLASDRAVVGRKAEWSLLPNSVPRP